MIPSRRDTERVCRERGECTLSDEKPRCEANGNRHVRCERVLGHPGAHYAQVANGCGPGKPAHCRWVESGRMRALYPRKR